MKIIFERGDLLNLGKRRRGCRQRKTAPQGVGKVGGRGWLLLKFLEQGMRGGTDSLVIDGTELTNDGKHPVLDTLILGPLRIVLVQFSNELNSLLADGCVPDAIRRDLTQ
jgi:hypothetical protein